MIFSFEDKMWWIQTGEKKLTYNQTTEFADSEIFKVVNSSKVNLLVPYVLSVLGRNEFKGTCSIDFVQFSSMHQKRNSFSMYIGIKTLIKF